MDKDSLTRIRVFGDNVGNALNAYIYGGIFAPPQVPRGIDREEVAEYVLDKLTSGDSPSAFAAVLQIMRFYELREVAMEVVGRAPNRLDDADDVRRACYLTQIGVEFGAGDMPDRADRYLDVDVLRSPAASDAFDILLQTRATLAPRGSFDRLNTRIQQEFVRREAAVEDEETLMAFDRIAAIVNNDVPKTIQVINRKTEITALKEDERISALLQVYLGFDDISDASTEVWAGRLLRKRVTEGDRQIVDRLGKILDPIVTLDGSTAAESFLFERAVNAFNYLGGVPTQSQVLLASRIEAPGVHFLSDEPVGWLERRMAATPQG